MARIELQNRDGLRLWLEEVSPTWYALSGDKESKWALHYIRIGYNDDTIAFVDPPGGPMLAPGTKLGERQIKEIWGQTPLFKIC